MFNLYSVPDQKSNADDNLPYLLDRLGFKQNYIPEFTRLGLRIIAVAIAGALFWYERQVTWPQVYPFIVAGVSAYFGLQAVAWLIKRFVEQGAIYIGTKDGKTLRIKTSSPASENEYKVECIYDDDKRSTFTCKFSDFIDHNGQIVAEKLSPLLAAALEKEK